MALLGLHVVVSAQITFPMDTVKVNASRIPTSVKESGKSVSLFTREDIEAMPATSVDELLQSLPGVNINSRNAFGVQADIGMRGSTFSQVLVMVDGIRINDPLTAHFNNNIPVALAEIDRIEVIRGPAATSFGPDAVGGIIHIKTKTFSDKQNDANLISSTVDAGIGEHGLLLTDGGIFVRSGKLMLSGGLKTSISDGIEQSNPNYFQGTSSDSLFRNYFDLQTYSLSASYSINDAWNVYSRIGYDERDFSAKYFYTASTYDESTEQINSWWTQFALTRDAEDQHTELNIGYKATDDLFIFNPAFEPNAHTTGQLAFSLNHQFNASERFRISLGTQGLQKTIESTDRGNHENSSIGIYSIVSTPLTEELTGTGSLRLEYDENFGLELLPQFSLAMPLEKITLRTSFGKAIRGGDFTERYISSQINSLTPGRNIGNPDLEAERSYTIDAGFDLYPSPGFTFSNTVFYRASDNLIDYTLTNSDNIGNADNLQPDSEYFYTTNVSNSSTFGIETLISKYLMISPENLLHAELNYTYLYTTNDAGTVSKYIANHPKHDLSVILSYSSKYFGLTSTSSYIQRNKEVLSSIGGAIDADYFVSHIKLTVHPTGRKDLQLYTKIHNILNTKYQEYLGAQMPGRWIMGGIKWSFSKITD
ncbi:MAG TPA: hypothetical protein DEQ34_05810 [Balneolaceae bacterium]|nr:hypothetical protein [Balneolaceae bacterium]